MDASSSTTCTRGFSSVAYCMPFDIHRSFAELVSMNGNGQGITPTYRSEGSALPAFVKKSNCDERLKLRLPLQWARRSRIGILPPQPIGPRSGGQAPRVHDGRSRA